MGGLAAMRNRLLLTAGVVVALLSLASFALAGDFHRGVTLKCQDCHVMHYSQQHGYNPNGSGNWTALSGGPHEFLLRDDINDLCLACHDGQAWAPDVFEANTNSYVRQGGALNEVGGDGVYPPTTGHTLGSTDMAPGGTFQNLDGLVCTDCHAAHGSGSAAGYPAAPGSYRNLGGSGAAVSLGISYNREDVDGANDGTKWVSETASSGTSANHYGVGAITFNEPDQTKSQYGAFCKGCHTDFHGDVTGTEIGGVLVGSIYEEFHRHPTNGVNIGAAGGGHSSLSQFNGLANNVQVMSPTGQKPPYDTTTDAGLTPSCFSCHKGHGNQNAFGLIYMIGTGTITEQGDNGTQERDLCRQCHRQGTPD
jgi:hypothetical protein